MALTAPLWKSAEVKGVPARTVRRTTRPASCAGSRKVSIASAVGRSIVVRSSGVRVVPSATSCSAVTTDTVCGRGGLAGAGLGAEHQDAAKGHHGQQDAQQEHQAVRALQEMVSTLRVTGEATV